ncbi:hypothetical protein LCGC14_0677830 [marine sediment metagenome]|uniref:Uncharacterized protein n=1 Tax=marine sediment metagenome TaxID=412755 RepID=A0A0F9TX34_9ZZZZ
MAIETVKKYNASEILTLFIQGNTFSESCTIHSLRIKMLKVKSFKTIFQGFRTMIILMLLKIGLTHTSENFKI